MGKGIEVDEVRVRSVVEAVVDDYFNDGGPSETSISSWAVAEISRRVWLTLLLNVIPAEVPAAKRG